MNRKSERGEGRLGLIVWLLVASVVGLFLWQYVPARITRAEIKDFVVEQTRYAAKATNRQMTEAIINEAERHGIEFGKDAIQIEKKGGRCRVQYEYTQVLEFPGYTYVMEVDETVDRPFYDF